MPGIDTHPALDDLANERILVSRLAELKLDLEGGRVPDLGELLIQAVEVRVDAFVQPACKPVKAVARRRSSTRGKGLGDKA